MKKSRNQSQAAQANPLCVGLMAFLAGLPIDHRFNAQDWLGSLHIDQLRHIETGAHALVDDREPIKLSRIEAQDLAGLTLLLAGAESKNRISPEKVIECLDIYLAGLSCAACIERISRLGWVKRTAKIGLYVQGSFPIEVTEKGRTEAVWAAERRVLGIMGLANREH
jgi:hypothetical protein